ncbi:MAG: hypothetical protein R8G34_19400 [Paracoccaceae bacterium]|nr:hypothetical protein [Paracoccaceae bacterium]
MFRIDSHKYPNRALFYPSGNASWVLRTPGDTTARAVMCEGFEMSPPSPAPSLALV